MLPVFEIGDRRYCTYCGDAATNRDHVIPVSYQHVYEKRKHSDISLNGPWCWACKDCNSKLSSFYFDTFKERCQWASKRIGNIRHGLWAEDEMEEMDRALRDYIKSSNNKSRWLEARASYYGTRDFYLSLESLLWQVDRMEELTSYFASMCSDVSECLYRSKSLS